MKRFDWPKSANEHMKHFGGTRAQAFALNKHEKEFIRESWNDNYLLIDCRERKEKYEGWCTHCQRWEKLSKLSDLGHLAEIECPRCGEKLKIIHTWKRKKAMRSAGLFYLYRQSVINPEIVTCRVVWVSRAWSMGGAIEYSEYALVDSFLVFEPGKKAWQLRPSGAGTIINGAYWHDVWGTDIYDEAKTIRARDWAYQRNAYNTYQMRDITIAADTEGAFDAARDSPLRYGMEEWIGEDHFITYWNYAARFPAVEWLLKMGFGRIVREQLSCPSGNIGRRTFDANGVTFYLKGKTLRDVMHGISLTKADKLCALKRNVSKDDMKVWMSLEGKIPLEVIVNYDPCYGDVEDIQELEAYVKPLKLLRYLTEQNVSNRGKAPLSRYRRADCGDYLDYIKNAEKLGLDIKSKRTIFPTDFWKTHDETVKMIEFEKNKKLENDYQKKRYPEMKKRYTFEDKKLGMKIVVPKMLADYIVEGEAQHNCVGTYCNRIAKGETDVVFVRRIENPDTAYITMEIKKGQIKQARTFANGPLDEAGKEFVARFENKKLKSRRKTA